MNSADYYTPELTVEQVKRSGELKALSEPSEVPAGTKPYRVFEMPPGLSEEGRKGFMLGVGQAAHHRNKEAANYREAGATGGREKSAGQSACWEMLANYSGYYKRPVNRDAIRQAMRSIARKEPGAEFQDDCFNVDGDSLAVSTCWNRLKKEPAKLVFKDD